MERPATESGAHNGTIMGTVCPGCVREQLDSRFDECTCHHVAQTARSTSHHADLAVSSASFIAS